MALSADTPIIPPPDASPEQFGLYWLGVAEDAYTARKYDQSTAAAQIASAHFQRAALPATVSLEHPPGEPSSARLNRAAREAAGVSA